MTRQQIVAFFEGLPQAWLGRDSDALGAFHAELGTIESPMFGRRQGRQAIADSYKALFATFPDWDFLAEDILVDGDRVAQPFCR